MVGLVNHAYNSDAPCDSHGCDNVDRRTPFDREEPPVKGQDRELDCADCEGVE